MNDEKQASRPDIERIEQIHAELSVRGNEYSVNRSICIGAIPALVAYVKCLEGLLREIEAVSVWKDMRYDSTYGKSHPDFCLVNICPICEMDDMAGEFVHSVDCFYRTVLPAEGEK